MSSDEHCFPSSADLDWQLSQMLRTFSQQRKWWPLWNFLIMTQGEVLTSSQNLDPSPSTGSTSFCQHFIASFIIWRRNIVTITRTFSMTVSEKHCPIFFNLSAAPGTPSIDSGAETSYRSNPRKFLNVSAGASMKKPNIQMPQLSFVFHGFLDPYNRQGLFV